MPSDEPAVAPLGSPASASARRLASLACAGLLLAGATCRAETRQELWPELDAYVKIDARTRAFLLAGITRVDNGFGTSLSKSPPLDGVVGAHLDFSLAPEFRPELLAQNWARNRYLWARVGYQYSHSLGADEPGNTWREHRGVFELNARTAPLPGGLEWLARARWDLRDRNGENSSLYRFRVGVERQFPVMGYATVPFADAETIYDTRYDTWKQQRYRLGAELPLNVRWKIEPAFTLQLDEISSPRRVLAFGLTLKYFQ